MFSKSVQSGRAESLRGCWPNAIWVHDDLKDSHVPRGLIEAGEEGHERADAKLTRAFAGKDPDIRRDIESLERAVLCLDRDGADGRDAGRQEESN